MNNNSIKILITMIIFASAIFCADMIFAGGAFSSFYVLVVLLSLWSEDDVLLVGGCVISIVLIFSAYVYSLSSFEWPALINKLVSFVMIGVTAGLSMRMKEKSQNLKRLNETLELRVLARIASSEAKSKRLEKEIEILQTIRKNDTNNQFSALDEVITNLRTLAVEKHDSMFEALK